MLVLRFPQTSGSRQRSDRCADGGFASLLKNCCRSAGDPVFAVTAFEQFSQKRAWAPLLTVEPQSIGEVIHGFVQALHLERRSRSASALGLTHPKMKSRAQSRLNVLWGCHGFGSFKTVLASAFFDIDRSIGIPISLCRRCPEFK